MINLKNKLFYLLFTVTLVAYSSLLLTQPVVADMGPKPQVTIEAVNMPTGLSYMDLLTDEAIGHQYSNIDDPSRYNQMMLEMIKISGEDGWHAAYTQGSNAPIFGDIICQTKTGKCNMTFSYMGVPDRFKVVVVTEAGEVLVSNLVKKKAFQSRVKFDYSTGVANEISMVESSLLQFFSTLIPTLLIELLVLILFRFSVKKNWKTFIAINGLTQLMLTLLIISVNYSRGMLAALGIYILAEFVILLLEWMLFRRYLKEHSQFRKGLYAFVANTASFAAGIYLLML